MGLKVYDEFSNVEWQKHFRTNEVPEDVIETYACQFNEVTWRIICQYQKLTGRFIAMFKYDIPIRDLLQFQVVHQNIIEEHIDFFQDYMFHVCKHQYITEDFIIKHKDIVNWPNVFRYQEHISIVFIKRHFSRYFGKKEFLDSSRSTQYFSNAVALKWHSKLGHIVSQHNDKVSTIRKAKHRMSSHN